MAANLTTSDVSNFTATHIYGSQIESQDFVPCFNKAFNMSSGEVVSIKVNNTQVELQNRNLTAKITKFDLFFNQGVIHLIDNALATLSPVCNSTFEWINHVFVSSPSCTHASQRLTDNKPTRVDVQDFSTMKLISLCSLLLTQVSALAVPARDAKESSATLIQAINQIESETNYTFTYLKTMMAYFSGYLDNFDFNKYPNLTMILPTDAAFQGFSLSSFSESSKVLSFVQCKTLI